MPRRHINGRRVPARIEVDGDHDNVGAVEISVNIEHTYVGDLSIVLRHGDQEALLYRGNGPGRDLQTPLSTDVFNGASAAGAWTLAITDSASRDEGVLRAWSLQLTSGHDTPNDDPGADPGVEPQELTSAPSLAIEDMRRSTDTITILVDGGGAVGTVAVMVSIRHTYVGDLLIVLEHDGQTAELQRFSGGSADTSRLSRTFGTSTFNGHAATGDWKLIVEDHANVDEGTLDRWSLSFE